MDEFIVYTQLVDLFGESAAKIFMDSLMKKAMNYVGIMDPKPLKYKDDCFIDEDYFAPYEVGFEYWYDTFLEIHNMEVMLKEGGQRNGK